MKLICGLGNPGSKYKYTRHNAGFLAIDNFAASRNCSFKLNKSLESEIAITEIGDSEIILMKPLTYMNNSGEAVFEAVKELNIPHRDILIIVDDFQIPLGTIRIRGKGSDGGHNGIESIIYHLNSDEFPRMRIGIGIGEVIKKEQFIDFVLGEFSNDELNDFEKLYPVFNDCIQSFILKDLRTTMNDFNKHFLNSSNNN